MYPENPEIRYLSEKMRLQLRDLLVILVIALIFSFSMGIWASILVNYFMLGTPINLQSIFLAVAVSVASIIISLTLYYWNVFAPSRSFATGAFILLTYNLKNCTVIEDPFDGYLPQVLANSVFQRFTKDCEKVSRDEMNPMGIELESGKHVMTELLECIVMLHLSVCSLPLEQEGLEPVTERTDLPQELKRNRFISFLQSLPYEDKDKEMLDIRFKLPKDVNIEYSSPDPTQKKPFNVNSFKIGFVSKHLKVDLEGQSGGFAFGSTMISRDPIPMFWAVPLRDEVYKQLEKVQDEIITIMFSISIRARFEKPLRPSFPYMKWMERWINRFVSGDWIGKGLPINNGFDFEEFRKGRKCEREQSVYELVKEVHDRVRPKIKGGKQKKRRTSEKRSSFSTNWLRRYMISKSQGLRNKGGKKEKGTK